MNWPYCDADRAGVRRIKRYALAQLSIPERRLADNSFFRLTISPLEAAIVPTRMPVIMIGIIIGA